MIISETTVRVRREELKRIKKLRKKEINEPNWSVICRALDELEKSQKVIKNVDKNT